MFLIALSVASSSSKNLEDFFKNLLDGKCKQLVEEFSHREVNKPTMQNTRNTIDFVHRLVHRKKPLLAGYTSRFRSQIQCTNH